MTRRNPLCSEGRCRFPHGKLRLLEGRAVCRQCWEAIRQEREAHNRRHQYDDRFAQMSTPEWYGLPVAAGVATAQ